MEYNLKLPQSRRYKFAEPLDTLISGKRENTIPKVEKIIKNYLKPNLSLNFYIVGDIVTQDFLGNQFLKSFIKICIIDEKTQRNRITIKNEDFFDDIILFENPAGIIRKESWSLIRNVLRSQKTTLVKITKGEEDLLVLPLVLEIPIEENVKNFVFYGQPPITDAEISIPEGIVIVDVTLEIQEKVKNLIGLMEKI
jgi:uncharacterized protein (UPF0218 family)